MEMNWDYIAGFFDGEGSINTTITKSHTAGFGYNVRAIFRISQKNREILDKIKEFMALDCVKIKEDARISFTQRAYNVHTERLDGLQYICDKLKDRVYVKKKQIMLLQKYVDIKSAFHHRSCPKEVMVQLLQICKEISKSSIKPNLKFQAKVDAVIKEIENSSWSPEVRYQRMSEHRKKQWVKIKMGIIPCPDFSRPKKYASYLEEIKQHPENLTQIFREAKQKLSEKTYLRFKKEVQSQRHPIFILPETSMPPRIVNKNGTATNVIILHNQTSLTNWLTTNQTAPSSEP